jgi:hypothetical protein
MAGSLHLPSKSERLLAATQTRPSNCLIIVSWKNQPPIKIVKLNLSKGSMRPLTKKKPSRLLLKTRTIGKIQQPNQAEREITPTIIRMHMALRLYRAKGLAPSAPNAILEIVIDRPLTTIKARCRSRRSQRTATESTSCARGATIRSSRISRRGQHSS